MGYPGHINCTDNFNHALDPFGVGKRKGLGSTQLLLQLAHERARPDYLGRAGLVPETSRLAARAY